MEYWMFVLFNLIFALAAMLADFVTGLTSEWYESGPIYFLYAIATFLPGLALSVRRLHDIGKSGWYLLLWLIPCVGAIILLVFVVTPGDPGSNTYGDDPIAYP